MSIAQATVKSVGRAGLPGWLGASLGCALVLAAALAAAHGARSLFPPLSPKISQAFMGMGARAQVETWRKRGRPPGGLNGVVFGDSVFAPVNGKHAFVAALAPALRTAGLDANVLAITQAGFGSFQFYYLLDAILAAAPDFAVVEVNLRTFAPDWYRDGQQRFAALSAELSPAQVWRLHGALATQEVGMLTPLHYRFQLDSGLFVLIEGSRSAGLGALDQAGAAANRVLGLSVRSAREIMRETMAHHVALTRDHAKQWYGQNFVASPVAEVMRAISEDLRAAGVKTVFVVAPVQRRRLRLLGITPADLRARTEPLRQMLGAANEDWIDATELFQTTDFLDGMHVDGEHIRRMVRPVADRLAARFPEHEHLGSTDTLVIAPAAP